MNSGAVLYSDDGGAFVTSAAEAVPAGAATEFVAGGVDDWFVDGPSAQARVPVKETTPAMKVERAAEYLYSRLAPNADGWFSPALVSIAGVALLKFPGTKASLGEWDL